MTTAVNIETSTPMINVTAKPLTKPVPISTKINAVIIDDILPSRMDVHARLKPSSIALKILRHRRTSSFVLSKIKILASTAIPMESTNPAIPGRVNVMEKGVNPESLKIATISAE